MKKYTAVFMVSAAVFCLALHALFISCLIRTEALNSFIFIRKMLEKNARLSVASVDSCMEFKKSPSTAILAMPSCNPDNTLVPESFDFFVMHSESGSTIFSVYPSKQSARKHAAFHTGRLSGVSFSASSGFFGFSCIISGRPFSRSFYVNPSFRLLPDGPGVF